MSRIAHHGLDSDVRMNDVFFSLHASIMTTIGLIQICSYERGTQRVTLTCWFVTWTMIVVVLSFGVPLALSAFPNISFVRGWSPSLLGFLYILSYIKIIMTLIKYIPQVGPLPVHDRSLLMLLIWLYFNVRKDIRVAFHLLELPWKHLHE